MSSIKVAALQLPTLGMSASKLDFYIKNAHKRGSKILVLGEYVLNHFFKELESMPHTMIKEQTQKNIELLKRYALEYNMIFIAPIIQVKKKKFYKEIAKIAPKSISYYTQQILIPYSHWNEKSFFANPVAPLKEPMIFNIDGIKVCVFAGFELHFDHFWQVVMKKKVDLVILPTVSTFESHNRWREILKTKAFLHSCYIVRANRVGEYMDKKVSWNFYGDTMIVDPQGEVDMMLEDKESMLIETVSKEVTIQHRKDWGFHKELKVREIK